jgi:aminoglycoside 6'-N-acetyltransferase
VTIQFRPLEREDFPAVSSWLAAPHVAVWWRDSADIEAVWERYEPRVSGLEPTEVFVVEFDGIRIGLIQRYRMEDYPEWGRNAEWEAAVSSGSVPRSSAGIDYLIGDDRYVGRGIGVEMIASFVELVWDRYSDLTGIVVEVEETNRRSWRALEKARFERVWAGVPNSKEPEDGRPNYLYVRLHQP